MIKYRKIVKMTSSDNSKTRANLEKLRPYSESAPFKTPKNTPTLSAKKCVLTSVIDVLERKHDTAVCVTSV